MTLLRPRMLIGKLRKHRRTGGAILECVLVMMLLLNMAFGMVEFGWYLYVRHSFEGAAREGARAGIVAGASNSNVTTAVSNYISAVGLTSSGYTTTIQSPLGTNCNVGTCTAGTAIYVTVSATWSVAGAGFRPLSLISSSKIVKGVTAMGVE